MELEKGEGKMKVDSRRKAMRAVVSSVVIEKHENGGGWRKLRCVTLECGHSVAQGKAVAVPKKKYCETCHEAYVERLPEDSREKARYRMWKVQETLGLSDADLAQRLEVLLRGR